ncbi:MAG: metal-dependent transcriptional regulator [Ruminococcaceae bacterium]|nr:metal-dependent transcriptional regulator [Oscillospiraceae bacterium]
MRLHESAEMYIETIYILSQKSSSVRSIDVADYMGYSKPSVSRAVGLLKSGGYLNMAEDGLLSLTSEGVLMAKKIFERHTVLSSFLESIGVSKETASIDACRIEHVISDETLSAIKEYLNK